ncbi:alpha/beta-hydrolase [Gymnopus androsaceus JB14]|uniref:Alpha/beta-hydrolase n=1 Tax=Gymnopus androsaceus JB14 TaxID=1447944 RepID=A0A6A4HTU0_9AGAR|nr:alpha/beta-hydrolase [Gymnopus androsaceus JB14]
MTSKPIEILFKHVDGLDIYMDVYLSPTASAENPAPILLWWHGGGLLQGTRKGAPPHFLSAPVKHNLTFVAADYRLAPQFRLPTILSDCADAMKFLHTKEFQAATEGRADASRVILSGSSAGAGLPKPPTVQGNAAIYPITDLEDPFWKVPQRPVPYLDRMIAKEEVQPFIDPADSGSRVSFAALDSPRSMFYHYMLQEAILADLLLSGTNIPANSFSVAPFLRALTSTIVPTYIVHGDADTKVHVRQSRDVVEALKELNGRVKIDYEYEEIPGVDHLFDFNPECEMEKMYGFIEGVFR